MVSLFGQPSSADSTRRQRVLGWIGGLEPVCQDAACSLASQGMIPGSFSFPYQSFVASARGRSMPWMRSAAKPSTSHAESSSCACRCRRHLQAIVSCVCISVIFHSSRILDFCDGLWWLAPVDATKLGRVLGLGETANQSRRLKSNDNLLPFPS
jgi:hypothetical protein